MSEHSPENDLKQCLHRAAETIARRKKAPEMVFLRVREAILKEIGKIGESVDVRNSDDKKPPLITIDVARRIADDLVIRSRLSPETLLHWTILNDYIEQLMIHKVVHPDSRYFNVPQQIRRQLLTYAEQADQEDLACLIMLKNELLTPKASSGTGLSEEAECICSYIASAVLFGKVLTKRFHSRLLLLRREDVRLNPVAISIRLDGCEGHKEGAFYRYFLPPPASNYFLRCYLHAKKRQAAYFVMDYDDPESFVFASLFANAKKYSEIFRSWLSNKFNRFGIKRSKSMTLNAFRDAALKLSMLEAITNHDGLSYPPFILAIQSGKIRSDSCVASHCIFEPSYSIDRSDYDFKRRNRKSKKQRAESSLSVAIKYCFQVLSRIRNENMLSERREMGDLVLALAHQQKDKLSNGAYENLMLLAAFIAKMLSVRKSNSKSKIMNHFIAAREFILNLPEIPVYALPKEEIIRVVKESTEPYKSDFVISGCQAFLDFLRSAMGDGFPVINLNAIRREHTMLRYPTPLIYPEHIDNVLRGCEGMFCEWAVSLKNIDRKGAEIDKAKHRAAMAHHMVCLGFFAGLRESEITGLRNGNVIYDEDGPVLCIRESKSNNGKRNIPLFALVPSNYLEILSDHCWMKKDEPAENWLFPDYDGSRLDAAFMAKRIQTIFRQYGIKNMVFHDMRHAFANFFVLRWFHAFYPDVIPAGLAILQGELFQEQHVRGLRKLILGDGEKGGQEFFSHGLAALSILMGHGGTVMTLEEYFHIGDWLFYLMSMGPLEKEISISSQMAASFLQLSYPSLPEALKGRKRKKLTWGMLQGFQQRRCEEFEL